MLIAVTVVRLLVGMYRADEAGEIVRAVWPLVAEDPDLCAQRFFLRCAEAHSLAGDVIGCRERVGQAGPAPQSVQRRAVPVPAADRIHALACAVPINDTDAERSALNLVRHSAPELVDHLWVVLAYRRWLKARMSLGEPGGHAVPALVDAVSTLIRADHADMAALALALLTQAVHDMAPETFAGLVRDQRLLPELVQMIDTTLAVLPGTGPRDVVACLSRLLAGWGHLGGTDQGEVTAMRTIFGLFQLRKAHALSAALTRPGPTPPSPDLTRSLALYTQQRAEPDESTDDPPALPPIVGDNEAVINSYLHSAEREPGSTIAQRRANLQRQVQVADTDRLLAQASAAPHRDLTECLRALPDDTVLLSVCTGPVGPNATYGLQMVLMGQGLLRMFWLSSTGPTNVQLLNVEEPGVGARIFPTEGLEIARLRRALVTEPLHRPVTRAAERELARYAATRFAGVLTTLVEFAATRERTRLVFWPHESLYFLPLHLLPVDKWILADHLTVTVAPSLECLFRRPMTTPRTAPLRAIASATGGLAAGLPAEPFLHEQATRIAALFDTRPLIGMDATPAAALAALGTSRYLHLAAHGAQEVNAPLFARIYLAGGALHAYEILERDLRETELVTVSACESALLRYDFLDNLHGLASAFLRAGARAVIGALWPVAPEVALTFFTHLYCCLALGHSRVDAFRSAQNQARAQHPDYRDWGAFTYFGW